MLHSIVPLPTHLFLLDDANELGVEAAVVLYHLKEQIERNKSNEDFFVYELYWCATSVPALLIKFPYFKNRKKIDRILKKLIDNNIIIDGKFNENKSDHTKWYALKPAGDLMSQNWDGAPEAAENLMSQNRDIDVPHLTHKANFKNSDQNENIELEASSTLMSQKRDIEVPEMGDRSPKCGTSLNISKKSLRVKESRDLDFDFLGNQIVDAFNQFANQYEKIKPHGFNSSSEVADQIRILLENYTVDEICKALDKIQDSSFLKGQVINANGNSFSLNIKFILQSKNFEKLASGGYADKPKNKNKQKFKTTASGNENRDWPAEHQKQLEKSETSGLAKTALERTVKFKKTSEFAAVLVEDGHETKMNVLVYNFFYAKSELYDNSHAFQHLINHFPEYKKN